MTRNTPSDSGSTPEVSPEDVAVRSNYPINEMFLQSGVPFDGKNKFSHFNFCGVEYTVNKEPDRMTLLVISAESPYHKSKYKAPFSDLVVPRLSSAAASSSAVAADEVCDEEYWQVKRQSESREVVLVYPGKDLIPPQDMDEEGGTKPLSEAEFSNLTQRLEDMLELYREITAVLSDLAAGSDSGKIRLAARFFHERNLKPEELQGLKALHECIVNNDNFVDRAVKVLLDLGVDFKKYFNDRSPMVLAAANGNISVCKALLDAGADPNSADYFGTNQYTTALDAAMMQGKFDVAILLISKGAQYNLSDISISFLAAFAAIKNNDSSSLLTILQHHPSIVNTKSTWGSQDALLHYAVKNRASDEVFDALKINGANFEIKNASGNSPLFLACHLGNYQAVLSLIGCGADINFVNQNRDSLLHAAIVLPLENRHNIIRKLISEGLDTDVVNQGGKTAFQMLTESKAKDKDYESGCILLNEEAIFSKKSAEAAPYVAVWAARKGKLKLLEDTFRSHPKVLVPSDANLETMMVHGAATSKRREIFEFLARKKFNLGVNIPVNISEDREILGSALHHLAIYGDVEAIENFLRVSKINPDVLDQEGMTPLQRVVMLDTGDNLEIVKFLIRNGADVNREIVTDVNPLLYCANKGNGEMVMALLEAPKVELSIKFRGRGSVVNTDERVVSAGGSADSSIRSFFNANDSAVRTESVVSADSSIRSFLMPMIVSLTLKVWLVL